MGVHDQHWEFWWQNTQFYLSSYFQNLPLPKIISEKNNVLFKYKKKTTEDYVP